MVFLAPLVVKRWCKLDKFERSECFVRILVIAGGREKFGPFSGIEAVME